MSRTVGRSGVARPVGLALAGLLAAVLTGCASGKNIRSAEDLVDDGERNVVLVSYDVKLDAFDRATGTDSAKLILRCGERRGVLAAPVCYELSIPFDGSTLDDGRTVERFALVAARPYRMDYGDYRIDSGTYRVVIGREPRVDCYTDKKGKTRCQTRYVDQTDGADFALPEPIDFRVSDGGGCYLGHLSLHLRGGEVIAAALDPTLDERAFEGLDPALAERSRAFVTRGCG